MVIYAKKRIIFYNDSPEFGGHEIMSAHFANELSTNNRVVYFHSHPSLSSRLSSTVSSIRLPFQSRTGTLSLPFNLNVLDILWLKKGFKKYKPDYVIIVQGAIDISLRGAIASRISRFKTLNYLPAGYKRWMMGLNHGLFFDRYFSLFYKLFHGTITISQNQKKIISSFVKKKSPVYVLENYINFDDISQLNDSSFFSPKRIEKIGWVGRVDWNPKGISFLLSLTESLSALKSNKKIIFIGDGHDLEKLKIKIVRKGLQDYFVFKGWVQDQKHIYSSFDLLLITSRYEGVPLTLLEAITLRKPVLARLTPATTIFKEYLPDLFLFKSVSEAVKKITSAENIVEKYNNIALELRNNLIHRHSRESFKKNVHHIFDMIENDIAY